MDHENGATQVSKGVDEVFENHNPVECDEELEKSEGDALGKPRYVFHNMLYNQIA